MVLSAVSVLVVAQSSSEIPEELMNNSVLPIDKLEHCALRFSVTSELKSYTQNLWTMELRAQDVPKICSVISRFISV